MSKMCLKNNNQHGFTLLEIMLVLLLMGMLSVGVVMTLPNNLISEENVNWQAQRFTTLLQFAEDEALISGTELGLYFHENSYQFVFYNHKNKKWLPVINKQITEQIEMPKTLEISYQLSGSVWDEITSEDQDNFIDDQDLLDLDGDKMLRSLAPQVYIMSSGEVTPFTLQFSEVEDTSQAQSVTVSVSMNGAITSSELAEK